MIDFVRIALSKPYTFVVLALMILLSGVLVAFRTPVDIFPRHPDPGGRCGHGSTRGCRPTKWRGASCRSTSAP